MMGMMQQLGAISSPGETPKKQAPLSLVGDPTTMAFLPGI